MPLLDAYEKLLQCEFTERSYRNEYQCVSCIQQRISEFKMAAVRRSLCLVLTIFTQKQLLLLQILIECQNGLHIFTQKDILVVTYDYRCSLTYFHVYSKRQSPVVTVINSWMTPVFTSRNSSPSLMFSVSS